MTYICPVQDLPSGYNSGEQYDTMSTGYMSGEAYELPEAREPLMEPTLASVEEISGSLRSEDLFTLTHSQVLFNGSQQLACQYRPLGAPHPS